MMPKEKFRNIGYALAFISNLILILTSAWAGIESNTVFIVRAVASLLLFVSAILIFSFLILKRKEQSIIMNTQQKPIE